MLLCGNFGKIGNPAGFQEMTVLVKLDESQWAKVTNLGTISV